MTKEELLNHQLAYNFDRDLFVYFNDDIDEHILDDSRDELF